MKKVFIIIALILSILAPNTKAFASTPIAPIPQVNVYPNVSSAQKNIIQPQEMTVSNSISNSTTSQVSNAADEQPYIQYIVLAIIVFAMLGWFRFMSTNDR